MDFFKMDGGVGDFEVVGEERTDSAGILDVVVMWYGKLSLVVGSQWIRISDSLRLSTAMAAKRRIMDRPPR
jgi:hypothetical protein